MILNGIIIGVIFSYACYRVIPSFIEYNQRTKFKRIGKIKDKVIKENIPLPIDR